jgi:outer membrane protein
MWSLGWAFMAAGEPLRLDEALEEALAANLELRQAGVALGMSEQALVRARSTFDPSLSLTVGTSATNRPNNDQFVGQDVLRTASGSWSAAVTQALPTGATATIGWWETTLSSNAQDVIQGDTVSDALSVSLRQPLLRGAGPAALWDLVDAKRGWTDAELQWRAAVEQTILDVSGGYWRLVSARASLDLAVRSREIAEQSLQDAQERFTEGFAGSGDVHQVERALGGARQGEVVARAEVEAAEMALRRLLGRDVATGPPLELVDQPSRPEVLPGTEEVLALAREGNAQWLRDQVAFERAQIGLRQARNGTLPDLAVTAGFGQSGLAATAADARQQALGGAFNDWDLGASVSVPLPGRAMRADLSSARLTAASARLALDAAEQDLVLRVRAAVRQVERDRLRVGLAADTVRFARLALEADQELLREGKGSMRNVVESLEALDRETAAELVALIDLQRSLLELKRVAGTLVGPGELPEPG